jgi:hypothetical protein
LLRLFPQATTLNLGGGFKVISIYSLFFILCYNLYIILYNQILTFIFYIRYSMLPYLHLTIYIFLFHQLKLLIANKIDSSIRIFLLGGKNER